MPRVTGNPIQPKPLNQLGWTPVKVQSWGDTHKDTGIKSSFTPPRGRNGSSK